jgi:YbgC/YbaW family acyl-CoA thioester hydrolase
MLRQAEWRDLDQIHHVNNANYVVYFEDCGIRGGQAFGWPMSRMVEAGFGFASYRYQIEYRQAALLDDQLEISFWLSDIQQSTAVRHYAIHRLSDQTLLARAHVPSAWINLATGKATPFPDDFLKEFAPCIVM